MMKTKLKNQVFLLALSLVCSLALLQGCAKDRPEQFAQGQGLDLMDRAQVENQTFPVNVVGSRSSAHLTVAGRTELKSEIANVKEFQILKFETGASLLGEVPFIGLPDASYEIRYVLTEKFLKVMKIGHPSDIPNSEHSYAEKLPDGRLMVPLVGYPVSYYRVEHQLNNDREKTQTLIQVPEPNHRRASHIRVDYNSREIFEPIAKVDVYPSNLFDGFWYYSETIIDTAEDKTSEIGNSYASIDSALNLATKIRFIKTKNSIRGVNVSIDSRLNADDEINLASVLEVPVEWKEYRARNHGSDRGMSEMEVHDSAWSNRPFMKTRFDEVKTVARESGIDTMLFSGGDALRGIENQKLVDLEITDQYIGFTVFRMEQGVRVKYAFLRADKRNYEVRRYFKTDRKRFGFFDTIRPEIQTFRMHRTEDFERNVLISRFNPNQEQIVFHFAHGTPEWLREIGRKAVTAWDETFQKAGTKTRVVLDESKDVSLGDLRYNVINLIAAVSGNGGLFGLGPSLTDPNTGEIISATANVHVTPIQETVVSFIRRYIAREIGLWKGKDISSPIVPSDAWEHKNISKLGMILPNLRYMDSSSKIQTVQSIHVHKDGKSEQKSFFPETVKDAFQSKNAKSPHLCMDTTVSTKYLDKAISEQCPEVVEYIQKLKSSGATTDDNEVHVLESCSRKVMREKVLSTLVHEMGHNFGLRHNFRGSNDVANFYKPEETGTEDVVRSSSTMEYTAFDEDRLTKPGLYDIAAIRYGYSDQVELENGKFANVSSRSIDEAVREASLSPRLYAYCTDEDTIIGADPMCRRHDAGVTPAEVVDHMIHEFKQMIASMNFRYDRAWLVHPVNAEMAVISRLLGMKQLYDEFRFKVREYVGSKSQYLENLNPEEYQKLLDRMSKDTRFAKEYALWRPAAEKVMNFMNELVHLPNRYCVVEQAKTRSVEAFELRRIREELYRAEYLSPKTCRDAAVQSYLQKQGFSLIDEVGFFLEDTRYSQSVDDLIEPMDVIGMERAREVAMMVMSARLVSSLKHINLSFFPNMIDEPDYQSKVLNQIIGRVFDGLSLSGEGYQIEDLPRFQEEKELLSSNSRNFLQGLLVPGKGSVNGSRLSLFSATTVPNLQAAQTMGAVKVFRMNSSYLACLSEDWQLCSMVIDKLGEIRGRLSNPGSLANLEPVANVVRTFPKGKTILPAGGPTILQLLQDLGRWNSIVKAMPAAGRMNSAQEISKGLQNAIEIVQKHLEEKGVREADLPAYAATVPLLSLGIREYPLAQESVQEVVNELRQKLPALVKQFERDIRYAEDFNAQNELLQRILLIQ